MRMGGKMRGKMKVNITDYIYYIRISLKVIIRIRIS